MSFERRDKGEEQPLSIVDLDKADDCFLIGAELILMVALDRRALDQCPGPVFWRLHARFQEAITLECGGIET